MERYFYLEEIQSALIDIGEPSSGSKSTVINRLVNSWESHNRNFSELLDYPNTQTLRLICKDYGLESSGDRTTLLRRVRRGNLISSANTKVSETETGAPREMQAGSPARPVPGLRRLRFKWPLWISLALTALLYFVLPLFGLTQIPSQLLTAAVCFIGLWSGLRFLSEKG